MLVSDNWVAVSNAPEKKIFKHNLKYYTEDDRNEAESSSSVTKEDQGIEILSEEEAMEYFQKH